MATAVEVQQALSATIKNLGWTAPTFLINYEAADSVKFLVSWIGNPTEGQFQIIGQVLLTVGQKMRDMRIAQQLQVKAVPNP